MVAILVIVAVYTIQLRQFRQVFRKIAQHINHWKTCKKNRYLKAPFQLDLWLKREGEKYGITKRRVQYQKKTEESENE
jgi:hypothetical protein